MLRLILAISMKNINLEQRQIIFIWLVSMQDNLQDAYPLLTCTFITSRKPYLSVFQQENAAGLDYKRQQLRDNSLTFNEKHVYLQEYRTDFFLNNNQELSTTFGNKIINQLKKTFKVTVKIQRIRLTFMLNKKQTPVDQLNFEKLTNKDYVYANLVDKINLPKQGIVTVMQCILLQGINGEQVKLPYSLVRLMRVDNILGYSTGSSDSKKKKTEVYCIRPQDPQNHFKAL